MSHHAMQRLAERCGARTPFDLLAAVDELWRGLELAINWDETVNKILAGERGVPMWRPKLSTAKTFSSPMRTVPLE